MERIIVTATVEAPLEIVWRYWTDIEHIGGWSFASEDWGAEGIINEVKKNGTFSSRLFAKDGSFEFLFSGRYKEVVEHSLLDYILDDGRGVTVSFEEVPEGIRIIQSFEPESENPHEMQREGWQAFLNNFKKYCEKNS